MCVEDKTEKLLERLFLQVATHMCMRWVTEELYVYSIHLVETHRLTTKPYHEHVYILVVDFDQEMQLLHLNSNHLGLFYYFFLLLVHILDIKQ